MRLLIVEDEPLIAQRLQRMCREIVGERLDSIRHAERFDEAQAYLGEHPVDLLLLDLNLRGRAGFDLLKTTVAGSFHTIIVSAHTDQALQAFDHGVLDFVAKPFDQERLALALHRALDGNARAPFHAKFLAVRKYGKVELIPLDELLYAKGAGPYSELMLANGTTELHDKSLEKLHALLPPLFERLHKSYLVRMSAVKTLHAHEGSQYEAELKNGVRLPVGRTRYRELRAKLV